MSTVLFTKFNVVVKHKTKIDVLPPGNIQKEDMLYGKKLWQL